MVPKRDINDRPDEYFVRFIHVFTLAGFAVSQPLYDIIGQEPTFLVAHSVGPRGLILLVFLLSAGVPLVLAVLEVPAGLVSRPLGRAIHAIVVFALLGLFFLPLVKRIDILTAWWATTGLALILTAILTWAYLSKKSLRSFVTLLTPAIVVFPLMFLSSKSTSSIFSTRDDPSSEIISLDSPAPIFIIVFDEFSSIALMNDQGEIDADRFPNLAAFAETAYWFRNATTSASMTEQALPTIVTGRLPIEEPGVIPIVQNYPDNLFTRLEGFYTLNVVEPVTSLCPDDESDVSPPESFLSLLLDTGIVYLHIVSPADAAESLPSVSQNWAGFLQGQDSASKKWADIRGVIRKGNQDEDFRNFVASIERSSRPTLNFMHILLPHVPYTYLPSGKRYDKDAAFRPHGRGKSARWGNDELGTFGYYQRYVLQVQFVDLLVRELIDTLKALKLYDESLIILLGDHGVSFLPGDYRRNLSDTNYAEIIAIPLFIKTPHQTSGVIDDRNAESIDILPTIAKIIGAQADWDFDGTSLVGPSTNMRSRKTVYDTESGVHYFSAEFPEKKDALKRKIDLFGVGRDPLDLYRFGPNKVLVGRHLNELNIVVSERFKIQLDQSRSFLSDADLEQDFIPAAVTGIVSNSSDRKANNDIAIALNGVIMAVTRTFMHGPQERFTALVPEWALRNGENQFEAFIVRKGDDDRFELLGSGHIASEHDKN